MTSLNVICSLPPPLNQKSWIRLRLVPNVVSNNNSTVCIIIRFRSSWKAQTNKKLRSNIADLNHKVVFFHGCEVALTSHICFPIRLVFRQHLNSHIAYPGIPPEPSNHTRGQYLHLPSYPLLRLLWSKSDNKVTRNFDLLALYIAICFTDYRQVG